jgi:hypothetical protein
VRQIEVKRNDFQSIRRAALGSVSQANDLSCARQSHIEESIRTESHHPRTSQLLRENADRKPSRDSDSASGFIGG